MTEQKTEKLVKVLASKPNQWVNFSTGQSFRFDKDGLAVIPEELVSELPEKLFNQVAMNFSPKRKAAKKEVPANDAPEVNSINASSFTPAKKEGKKSNSVFENAKVEVRKERKKVDTATGEEKLERVETLTEEAQKEEDKKVETTEAVGK